MYTNDIHWTNEGSQLMRIIKMKPVIIAFISCLMLCTVIWFGYRYFGIEKPIDAQLQSANYSYSKVDISNSEQMVDIDVNLKDGATLQAAISELQSIINDSKFMSYTINYHIQSSSSEELDEVWSSSLFTMADIMANKNFALIPDYLEQLMNNKTDLQAVSAIDGDYIYITLMKDQAVKHIILPLEAAAMEVWSYA